MATSVIKSGKADPATNIGQYGTLTALQNAIKAQGDTLKDTAIETISFSTSAAFTPFIQTGYIGFIFRLSNARYKLLVTPSADNWWLCGSLYNGTWTWKKLQYQS